MSESREQIEIWLNEARQAKHDLVTGRKEVSISYQGRTLTYNQTSVTMEQLDRHIADLEAKLKGGRSRARRVFFK